MPRTSTWGKDSGTRVSETQRRVLRELEHCIRANKQSPTLDELGAQLGIVRNAVWKTLVRLEALGLVTRTKNAYRSTQMTEKGKRLLRDERREAGK